ncbi:MAG: hypothetical protein V4456_14200 [Bacteroidota bacterium]|jgi:hypothetical protein|uniref:hypothetical protein n=1 Tax=Mucilaginibacter inviolabilis TaxID=2714892 RepID=UPI001409D6C9|nr:hypothetical protein [Mucilaginibacter inviolabilis]NHA05831.1 hypothetical protein [Mucilaginibacter inviolabilis]
MANKITEIPLTETYQRKISPVDFCAIYSLMLKRIAKGYSASEVSFLMGRDDGAVGKLERFYYKTLTLEYLHIYTSILDDDALNGIIVSDRDEWHDINYQIVKTTERTVIRHEVFEILNDNNLRQLFNLFEPNPEYDKFKYSTSYEMGIEQAREILKSLLEGVSFQTPESPLDIYRRCRRICTYNSFRPRYVQAALNDITQSKDYPKLKRIKTKKHGYLYEKAF